jgi:hypothetical protein
MIAEQLQEPQLPARRSFYKWEAAIIVAFVAAILLIATTYCMAGRDAVWIDPVTGSIKEETQWFGQTTDAVIKTSAIEKWINAHGDSHSNGWIFLNASRMTLFGHVNECGRAPAIYPLRAGSLDDLFVINSTEQEISDFVHVMQAGTEDEKQQAVQAAVQRAISQPPNRVSSAAIERQHPPEFAGFPKPN